MATVVKNMPAKPKADRTLFPHEWLNGQVWELGDDDAMAQQYKDLRSMICAIRNAAHYRGLRIQTMKKDSFVYIQAGKKLRNGRAVIRTRDLDDVNVAR